MFVADTFVPSPNSKFRRFLHVKIKTIAREPFLMNKNIFQTSIGDGVFSWQYFSTYAFEQASNNWTFSEITIFVVNKIH